LFRLIASLAPDLCIIRASCEGVAPYRKHAGGHSQLFRISQKYLDAIIRSFFGDDDE
jgi:hypothetical protein